MIESVLNSLTEVPVTIAILAAFCLAVTFTIIGNLIVSEFYTYRELVGSNEIVGIKYGLFGEIFSVILGLALVGAYTLNINVREISSGEVSALRSLYYSATERDGGDTTKTEAQIKATVVAYAKSVALDEWPLMASGKMSEKTSAHLKTMFNTFMMHNEPNIMNAAQLNFLGDIVKMRGLRATTGARTITQLIWVILVAGILLVFLGPVFVGAQNPFVQGLVTSFISTFILVNLLALVHLAHPFSGEFAVTAAPYLDFVEDVERGFLK